MTEDRKPLPADVAQQEFDRFAESMDLDFDERGMDDEDAKGFRESRRLFLRAVEKNRLVVNDDGEPVYTPVVGNRDPITFHEPQGCSFMASDLKKKGHDVGKMHVIVADFTQQPAERFAKMKQRDYKVVLAIALLILG